MYVSVMQMRFEREQHRQAFKLWHESILPELKRQEGWRNGALAPLGADGWMLFTLWEREEQAQGQAATPRYRAALARLVPTSRELLGHSVYRLGSAEEELLGHCRSPQVNSN